MDAFTTSNTARSNLSRELSVLNELLAVLYDSKDFFEQAEKSTRVVELNMLFNENANNRENSKEYVKNMIVARKGIAATQGTMSGELRKLYTEFLCLLSDDHLRLLQQMINHETRNKNVLDDLVDTAEPGFAAALVEEIKQELEETINTMKDILAREDQSE